MTILQRPKQKKKKKTSKKREVPSYTEFYTLFSTSEQNFLKLM